MNKFTFVLSFAALVWLGLGNSPVAYAGEGYDAGYEWAEQHDIDDPDYSNGNSESFNEGVRQYVEDNKTDEDEDGSEDGE